MERLSTQTAGAQDGNACISLCYQPVNVQTVENQTAVAVQSLIESQGIQETQDEEEDIFQCGKCKKQFTSIQLFLAHKQVPCILQQPQQQQPQQVAPPPQLQQQQSLALAAGNGMFAASTLNIGRSFPQTQINNNSAPILQAHPVLSRTLNQPTNGQTLTLGGLPPSPISQLPQNMIFTGDDLMALANLDTSALNTPSIQMVTGTVQPNNSNALTILSPIGSLAGSPNNTFNAGGAVGQVGSAVANAGAQLLMQQQPTPQQMTLATITDSKARIQQQLQQQPQQQPLPQQTAQVIQQQTMPPLAAPPPIVQFPNIQPQQQQQQQSQPVQQQLQIQQQQQLQQHIFKTGPTKAGRKSAQNLITVMNAENNSVSLLSTRKGKTARNASGNKNIGNSVGGQDGGEEEAALTKPRLRCEYCNKSFSKNFDLQQHIRAHTGEKPFQCIVCGRAFAQKSNVKKHMATHKVWPCGISNTLPKQPEPVIEIENNKEEESVADTNSFMIPATDSAVGLQENGTMDEAERMASELKEDQDNDEKKLKVVVDNSYICQYCPAKFKTYYQLKTHLVDHKNEQVYKCMMKTCGQSFHELDNFLKHVKTHENEMTYRCHKCHKYFPSLYELGVHQFTHSLYPSQGVKSGPRHFQCTKCGNKYTSPEALEHHLSTTSHDYRCPHCEKQFTCERFLRRHLPIHGTDGQFECSYCQKKFKTEHYLKTHTLIHTGETPFSCHLCQAMFNRKDKLKRHMTIHDAVKKYRCPFRSVAGCTKEFNRPDKLKAHIITHSGIKPHKCSVCQKGFSRKPHLLEHERGHRADYRYKCEKCGKGFFRPKLFKEHKCSSTMITEQIFRPKNKRKIGRPKKRMVTITADSIAKCRGKRYVSRTRGRERANNNSSSGGGGIIQKTSAKQSGTATTDVDVMETNNDKRETSISTHSAVIEAAKQSRGVKEEESLLEHTSPSLIHGMFGDDTKTVSVELVKAVPLMSSGGDCTAGLIDLDASGIGVDHYVVHLAESVDGSSSVQTAFIPAVSGNQIFAAAPGGVGIQPIAIIEAAQAQSGLDKSRTLSSLSSLSSLQTVPSSSSLSVNNGDLNLNNLTNSLLVGGNVSGGGAYNQNHYQESQGQVQGHPNMIFTLSKTTADVINGAGGNAGCVSLSDTSTNGLLQDVVSSSLLSSSSSSLLSSQDKSVSGPHSILINGHNSVNSMNNIRSVNSMNNIRSVNSILLRDHHSNQNQNLLSGSVSNNHIILDNFSNANNVNNVTCDNMNVNLNANMQVVGKDNNNSGIVSVNAGHKDNGTGNVIVIKNENLVGCNPANVVTVGSCSVRVSGGVVAGGNNVGNAVIGSVDLEGGGGAGDMNMMDMTGGSLALFQAAASSGGVGGVGGLVEGQVVVSGSQAFLACPPTLVDYSGDSVYTNKSSM